jgi:hypothetical protein
VTLLRDDTAPTESYDLIVAGADPDMQLCATLAAVERRLGQMRVSILIVRARTALRGTAGELLPATPLPGVGRARPAR